MQTGSVFIGLASVFDKVDHDAIEQTVSQLTFPSAIAAEYEKLVVSVIVRGDNVYPEEHYRIGKTLYVALQFDPDQVLSLSTPEVTALVRDKTEAYLAGITEVKSRKFSKMRRNDRPKAADYHLPKNS